MTPRRLHSARACAQSSRAARRAPRQTGGRWGTELAYTSRRQPAVPDDAPFPIPACEESAGLLRGRAPPKASARAGAVCQRVAHSAPRGVLRGAPADRCPARHARPAPGRPPAERRCVDCARRHPTGGCQERTLVLESLERGASSWAEEVGLARPEPRQVIEFDTTIAAVRAAERGAGIALVPVLLCQSWIRSGALVRVFAVELAMPEAYYLVSRPRDAERASVQALTRWALAQYRRA